MFSQQGGDDDDGEVAYLTGVEGGGLKIGEFPLDRLVLRYAFEDSGRAYTDAAANRVIKAVLGMD